MFCMIYHSHLVMEPSQPLESYYSTPAVSAGPHVVFKERKHPCIPRREAAQQPFFGGAFSSRTSICTARLEWRYGDGIESPSLWKFVNIANWKIAIEVVGLQWFTHQKW